LWLNKVDLCLQKQSRGSQSLYFQFKHSLKNKNLVVILKGYLIISVGEKLYKNVV
jgi:hypothetical protein